MAYDKFVSEGKLFDSQGDNCLVDFERKQWESDKDTSRRADPPDWFEGSGCIVIALLNYLP